MLHPNNNLGELRSDQRPTTWRLWLMAIFLAGPLFILGLGIVVLIDDYIQGKDASLGKLATPLGCLGAVALILLLLISLLISEIRKWYPTRSVRLKIFEHGFTYREPKGVQTCAWNEIKDITHRTDMVHSKHSPPRRVSVIRSIVKTDGTVIVLAQTLNLHKLTSLISAATKSTN